MISAKDFRCGIPIQIGSDFFYIMEFQQVKPDAGAAFVHARLRDIRSNEMVEKNFMADEKCQTVDLEMSEMEYLYLDYDTFNFMDTETYEQIELNMEKVKRFMSNAKEGDRFMVVRYKGEVLSMG